MASILSETEPMDTLPFVKDPSPLFGIEEKIVAPSIEEVDSNPEQLRSIRGVGRYFGINDSNDNIKSEPKCSNCSQRGHLRKHCPHVICSYCGLMDDHYSSHCPKTTKCSHCNGTGHYRQHCPEKWKRIFCTLCNSKKHSRDRCPSIWRSYYLNDSSIKRVLVSHKIYCYNCGDKGHFGDNCMYSRSSRVPNDDGSAFAGDNLPKKLKPEYYTNIAKFRQESFEDGDNSFDYNDYEFNDSFYDNDTSDVIRYERLKHNEKPLNFYPPPYNKRHIPSPLSQSLKYYAKTKTTTSRSSKKYAFDPSRNYNRNSRFGSQPFQNMNASRYAAPSSYRDNNNDEGNYKNYNVYQPSRSGNLDRRR